MMFAFLAVATVPLAVTAASPAAADDYPAVGHLVFETKHLLPYKEAAHDPHCEDTARRLCETVHEGGEMSYRAELLSHYCTTDQYKKCVWARSLSTRR